MKKYLFTLVLIGMIGAVKAQSVQDYFFKSWDLSYISPAALTQPGGLKGNMNYSQDLVGSVQSKVGGQVQLHTDFGTNHGAGVTMQSFKSGILTSNTIGAGYGYRIKLGTNQSLSAGGRFQYFKYSLNRAAVENADLDDPMLYGDMFQQSSLMLTSGLLYEWGKFKLAVNAPELMPLEGDRYARKTFSTYADYSFLFDDWQLRPNFYLESIASLGSWYEMALYTSYKNRVGVEVGYTSENAIRAKASVNHKAFTIGYGYNSGKTDQEGSTSQTGHRVYIGYSFGDLFANAKKRKALEKQEERQVEIIIKEKTQLIDDYKKVLGQTEANYVKALQFTADSLAAEMRKRYDSITSDENRGKASITGGYYVAIGAFDTMLETTEFIDRVNKAGFTSRVLYNSELKKFRVYLDNYKNYKDAIKWRNRLRAKGFTDSYIFIVQ